ncbi:MAG: OmpA family protein [Bacteroidota bacterium]|nr:OmpA family protein [Bacteroidota bacterium]
MMKYFALLMIFCMVTGACRRSGNGKTETNYNESVNTINPQSRLTPAKRDATKVYKVDFMVPVVFFVEISSKDIEVRGTDSYSIYSFEENILFDFDKSTIRHQGYDKLNEIIASINKRYPEATIAIYGFTDSIGSNDYNKQLALDRANTVKQYLQQKGNIESDRIIVLAKGEQNSVSTNESEKGIQKNRRVEIVAIKDDQIQ